MAGTSLSFLSLSLTSASTSSTPSPSLTPDAPDSVIAMGSSLISNYGSTLQVSESCSFFHFLGFSSLSVSPFDLLDRPRGTEEKIRALLSSLTLSLSRSLRPSRPSNPKLSPKAASSSVADIVNTALSTAATATAGAGGAVRRGAATADALYSAYRAEYCAPALYIPSTRMPANFTSERGRERKKERERERGGEEKKSSNLSPLFLFFRPSKI